MFFLRGRILIPLLCSLLFAGITLIVAPSMAQAAVPQQGAQPISDCKVCHQEIYQSWQSGSHGQAASDPIFTTAWTEQGKPGACLVCHTTGYDPSTGSWLHDGVACEACHSPVNANHPGEPMPIDKSTNLCGKCHSSTRFSWDEWKGSAHYQREMTCSICHDAHTGKIKNTQTQSSPSHYDDASTLCVTCHTETQMNFPFSTHFQKGLTCVDCHLKHMETQERQTHTIPDHSFTASLKSCNTCHISEMHGPTEEAVSVQTDLSVPPTEPQLAGVMAEPKPVSPFGFAVLAGMIGLAVGMVLSPWLEKAYRQLNTHVPKGKDEVENE